MAARQRFIWPDIWEDPRFGRLDNRDQVLFVALFSMADDDGRIIADAANLRSAAFKYQDVTLAEVEAARARVIAAMKHVCFYQVDGIEYIHLTSWPKRQKPRYPQPSLLPPCPKHTAETLQPSDEGPMKACNCGGEERCELCAMGRVGLGRVGLGRDGLGRDEDARDDERKVLATLRAIPGWPDDVEADLATIRRCAGDFPAADLLVTAGDLAEFYAKRPIAPKDNPRLRYRNFVRTDAEGRLKRGASTRASPPAARASGDMVYRTYPDD